MNWIVVGSVNVLGRPGHCWVWAGPCPPHAFSFIHVHTCKKTLFCHFPFTLALEDFTSICTIYTSVIAFFTKTERFFFVCCRHRLNKKSWKRCVTFGKEFLNLNLDRKQSSRMSLGCCMNSYRFVTHPPVYNTVIIFNLVEAVVHLFCLLFWNPLYSTNHLLKKVCDFVLLSFLYQTSFGFDNQFNDLDFLSYIK